MINKTFYLTFNICKPGEPWDTCVLTLNPGDDYIQALHAIPQGSKLRPTQDTAELLSGWLSQFSPNL